MAYDPGLIDLYTTQFTANLEMKLQQEQSLLRGKVAESGGYVGKQVSVVNQIGALSLKSPTGRFAPLDVTSGQYSRRWVTPNEYERAVLIDTFDELQTIVDPKSALVQSLSAAAGRIWDDIIINSAFASATIGTDPSDLTTEAWATTYDVADNFGAGAATGLTVAKLIEARRLLRHYHAIGGDGTPFELCLVIGSQQESDLLNQVQIVSTNFDLGVSRDANGQITRVLGFDVVVSERLQTSSGDRLCIAFVKSGLHLGLWQDMEVRIDRRIDLSSQPWQIYCKTMFGATRTQLGKIIRLKCLDSTGADPTVIN